MCYDRKVEDLQFRVEEESITKGDLEVSAFFYYFSIFLQLYWEMCTFFNFENFCEDNRRQLMSSLTDRIR